MLSLTVLTLKHQKIMTKYLEGCTGEYMTLPPIEQRIGSHGVIISFDNIIFYKLVSNEYKKERLVQVKILIHE